VERGSERKFLQRGREEGKRQFSLNKKKISLCSKRENGGSALKIQRLEKARKRGHISAEIAAVLFLKRVEERKKGKRTFSEGRKRKEHITEKKGENMKVYLPFFLKEKTFRQ